MRLYFFSFLFFPLARIASLFSRDPHSISILRAYDTVLYPGFLRSPWGVSTPRYAEYFFGPISFTALLSLLRENLPNFKLTERIHGSTPPSLSPVHNIIFRASRGRSKGIFRLLESLSENFLDYQQLRHPWTSVMSEIFNWPMRSGWASLCARPKMRLSDPLSVVGLPASKPRDLVL